jgi:phage repressor protein C with HTH and peptisase S24 domain
MYILFKFEHFVQKKLSTLNILYMITGKDLRKALKANDLTMETAADKMGISRGTLYNIIKKDDLDEDIVQNVQDKLNIFLNEPAVPYIQQRRENKNHDSPYLVPFVDIPAQAGYTKAYQQIDYIQTLKKYPILPDVDPVGAVWRYFQIEGDSMEPEIMGGDVILASQVIREDWQNLRDKYTHVVVTDEDLWIKDVHKLNDDEWILLSQNEAYEPFKLNVADVRQVWVMRRHIKSRAKKHRMYDMEAIIKKLSSDKPGERQDRLQARPPKQGVNPHPFEELDFQGKKKKKQIDK